MPLPSRTRLALTTALTAGLTTALVLTGPALAQTASQTPPPAPAPAPAASEAIASSAAALPPGVEADWLSPRPRPTLYTEAAGLPSRRDTMAAVDYVASSQIAAMAAEPIALSTGSNLTQMSSNWVAATFYVGAARLARVTEDPKTLRFLSAVADHYNYSLRGARSGKTLLNADDIAIGELSTEGGRISFLIRDQAHFRKIVDGPLAKPAHEVKAQRGRAREQQHDDIEETEMRGDVAAASDKAAVDHFLELPGDRQRGERGDAQRDRRDHQLQRVGAGVMPDHPQAAELAAGFGGCFRGGKIGLAGHRTGPECPGRFADAGIAWFAYR